MNHVIGALAGLLYGGLFALVKHLIRNSARRKQDGTMQIYIFLFSSMLINIGTLLSIYFFRNWLPWSFTAMLIAAALTLSLCGKLSALRLQDQSKDKAGEKPKQGSA